MSAARPLFHRKRKSICDLVMSQKCQQRSPEQVPRSPRRRTIGSRNETYGISLRPAAILLRLDVGGSDHLAPLLGFLSDELAEFGRRTRYPSDSEIVEPRLDLRIVERTLDFAVEPADKLRGCPPGGAEANPSDCFVAGHGFTNGRDFRQYVQSCRGGHA